MDRQDDVERWFDREACVDGQQRDRMDVVGRAAEEVKQKFSGEVPFVQDWANEKLERWREGSWCVVKVAGHSEGKPAVDCRVIGLLDRPLCDRDIVGKHSNCDTEVSFFLLKFPEITTRTNTCRVT
nr:hypothetical protein CFP56_11066 [Quercus suber]